MMDVENSKEEQYAERDGGEEEKENEHPRTFKLL
jgi:hypothetical protein